MSKLHTADLYTRVLELQHQLDTQRTEIKKVKAQHKKMRKHFTTMESLYGILDLLENFKYQNSGEATRIKQHLLRDYDIDLISAAKFIRALQTLALNTDQMIEDLA